MPEERITLKFRERGRIVWNREVVYQDYDLMGSRAYILAGNENGWLGYLEEKYFTPDFYIMVTSFDLVSVNLLIRYGAEAPKKWSCSGAPLYRCSEDINGIFPTQADCLSACKGAPCSPVWTCETPANGYESDGCGLRRANTRCDPLVSGPLSLSADKTTIKVGDLITFSGKYKSFAKVIIYEDSLLRPKITETTCNSAGNYMVVAYLNRPAGTYRIQAKSDALIFPDLSNIITITVTAAIPVCVPKWVCEQPLNGYETDGCGNRGWNSACIPLQIGNISFASTPPGAGIFMDGAYQNITTPATISNIPVGTHNVRMTLAGYIEWTGTVTITAGQTAYLNQALTLLGTIGALEISSIPAGARVFIDGADAQKVTPATITNPVAGGHTYKLVLSGYKDATGTFTIEAGKTTPVSVTLNKSALTGSALLTVAAIGIGIAVLASVAGKGGK